MNNILEDFRQPLLNTAIETNLFEWYKYLSNSPIAEFYEDSHIRWFMTGVLHPFLNGVFYTQLTSDNVDETIKKVSARFRNRHLPFMWWTGSTTQPVDLEAHLEDHGLIDTGGTPGMAVDLQKLHEDVSIPVNLTIKVVDDLKTLEQWVQTLLIVFDIPKKNEEVCFDLFASLGFDLPLRNYVGFLNGKVVAISSLFLGAGVAGIYCVATLSEARRRGIGSVITLVPLQDARAMGYRIGVLHASDMGFSVYRKLGFQKYCSLRSHVWRGESNQLWAGESPDTMREKS